MEEAGVKLIAQGSAAYDADMKSSTSATNTFVDATEKGGGRVSAAAQIMTGALRHIGTIAVDALREAARATAAFVGDSIGLAGDFEAGMREFQAVAGRDVDTKGLEKFHDLFLDLGKRLPVSTSEVQKAAVELIKGGIDPATIAAGGLESSIKFAAAAMKGDLVGAAEISAKIVGGWADVTATAAEKADLLAHSQDVLTKAANASVVGVDDLGKGLFNVQGNAKLAGMGLDATVQALALISPNFSSAATAGTSLNAMIARLQPSTDPAAQAMEGLGLYTEEAGSAFYDAQGEFVGWGKASQLLQDATVGLTDAQKQSVFQTIFGMDAQGAAAELTRQGAAGWDRMTESLDKANGVQENANIKQAGFNTALENAKGSVEAMQISIGEKLLPILTTLLNDTIAPTINALTDVAMAFFETGAYSSEFGESLVALANAMGLPGEAMQGIIFATQGVFEAFDEAGAMSSEFGEAIGSLATELGLPGELIQDIIFGIQGLVAWFGTAGTESGELGGAVDDLSGIWEHVGDVVADVTNAYIMIAQAVLPIVTKFIDEHGEEIGAFFKAAWGSIVEIVHLALQLYDAVVPAVLEGVAGFINDHGSEILKIMGGAWDMITSLITGALDTIKGVFKVALALLHGDWQGAWTGIQEIVDVQVKAIGGVVTGFLNLIAGIFDTSLSDIAKLWSDNWDMLVEIVTKVDWAEVGESVVDGILQGLRDSWDSLTGWISDKVGGMVDAALEAIGAGSPAKQWMPVGQFSVQGIMEGFSQTWPMLTDLVGTLSEDLVDEMKDIGRDMQGVIADSFGATASMDRQIAKNLDSFKDVLPQYAAFTTGALKEAQSQAEGFLDPAEGAKFFAMRSKQILEYAKLQKELSEAETIDDRARIEAQMLLINKAQTAEISQFNANQTAQQSAAQQMADSIGAVMAAISEIDLTDDQIRIVDMLSGVWAGLQAPVQSRADAYANPPQMQYPGGGNTTTSSTKTINMPIYTNQTPHALQQSWAVMQASMP